MAQKISWGIEALPDVLRASRAKRLFLVCGGSFDRLGLQGYMELPDVAVTRFSAFAPNPRYEDVCLGVELFRGSGCDTILAVGGGSAIDVAKCVKLFADSPAPLIALPTTAGTGSESTCHAVIYKNGEKRSVSDPRIVPDHAILEPAVLKHLPEYQKKCTLLDALCQGIESWWSVRSSEESIHFAREAVAGITEHWRAYLAGDKAAANAVLLAANASGRAINLTATTALHAMSYILTGLYALPHGHAVALCLPEVWEYMLAHTDGCVDSRGACHLERTLADIGRILTPPAFREMLSELEIDAPRAVRRDRELALLAASVNPERLRNNPVFLDRETLLELYERIVK